MAENAVELPCSSSSFAVGADRLDLELIVEAAIWCCDDGIGFGGKLCT